MESAEGGDVALTDIAGSLCYRQRTAKTKRHIALHLPEQDADVSEMSAIASVHRADAELEIQVSGLGTTFAAR